MCFVELGPLRNLAYARRPCSLGLAGWLAGAGWLVPGWLVVAGSGVLGAGWLAGLRAGKLATGWLAGGLLAGSLEASWLACRWVECWLAGKQTGAQWLTGSGHSTVLGSAHTTQSLQHKAVGKPSPLILLLFISADPEPC